MSEAGPELVSTLPFLVSIDDTTPGSGGRDMGIFGRDDGPVLREIPIEALRDNLARALDTLREVLRDAAARTGGLPLKEVQVSLEITASGSVAFLGTGAELAGTGSLTLTFGA